jgi:uncharacterized cupredoxin-like copper-binding protein
MKTTMRRAALVTAGLAVAGGAVFGATEAFAASPPASPSAASTSSAHAAPATSSSKTACKDASHPAKCTLRRAAGRERGAHGQATVKDKAGAYVVHAWQVGKVGSVNGSTVTVTDSAGTTWTWSVQSSTKYRVDGAKGALSGVHAGDTILIRGTQSGSANDATALFDPNQSKLGKG